jgi:hypothetical protein
VQIAAHNDADVPIAFLKVINPFAPLPSILHLAIVGEFLKKTYGQRNISSAP